MGTRRKFILGTLGITGALVVGWGVLPPRQRRTMIRTPLRQGRQRGPMLAALRKLGPNPDPLLLIEGGARLDARVDQLLDAYRARPHIFNLGHGILPDTPIENVELLLNLVRKA